MAPKKKKWIESTGKRLLINDLCNNNIANEGARGDFKTIYKQRVEFGGDDDKEFKLFNSRLKSARKQVKAMKTEAEWNRVATAQYRQHHPVQAVDSNGKPRWQGSMAETFLKQDIADKKHESVKPQVLYYSRKEYQVFELSVFRGHIHQELSTQRYFAQRAEARRMSKKKQEVVSI
jgi:hypothetical protein